MKAFLFLGNPRWPVTHRIYCFPSIGIRVCETSPGHVSNSAVTLHGDQTKCFSSPGQGDGVVSHKDLVWKRPQS